MLDDLNTMIHNLKEKLSVESQELHEQSFEQIFLHIKNMGEDNSSKLDKAMIDIDNLKQTLETFKS